jgi:hypothetical protein
MDLDLYDRSLSDLRPLSISWLRCGGRFCPTSDLEVLRRR